MMEISFFTGELVYTVIWILCRSFIWIRQKKVSWRREAMLLLMYVNLAVIIRFVFYPFFRVSGQIQPLIINTDSLLPIRLNLIPFVNMLDYEVKREAIINIVGNLTMFIPTGIILPILYRKLNSFSKVVMAGAGLSAAIELIQLFLPRSVTDIDDLILNVAGVAIGYGIYALARKLIKEHK